LPADVATGVARLRAIILASADRTSGGLHVAASPGHAERAGGPGMKLPSPLVRGRLVRRYKRFLADVTLETGETVTAHCPNSGRMTMCADPGWEVLLSVHDRPGRRLKYTWELVHNGRCWIGVNTHSANGLAREAVERGWIPELTGYTSCETERPYGRNSRIDLLLSTNDERCFVEVKNVTLVGEDARYCFPDAVTARGLKHLAELSDVVRDGERAVMLFVIQRSDGQGFRPAHEVDPAYAAALVEARRAGVEVLAYQATIDPPTVELRARQECCFGVASGEASSEQHSSTPASACNESETNDAD